MARGFSLVWSGPGIATFTATGDRPIVADAPTLLEIWVCADGYWCDLTKNICPGTLSPEYDELPDGLLGVYNRAIEPGAYWPGAGRLRLEDNFLVTADGPRRLCRYPDDFRTVD